ncbi:hypothetical protein [Micromonospora sp. NPDC049282]|uniref:hypothetical protein n=1 Tax=Micromonospora sp. NPDC049282 TaxID=3364269 RepID=UPI003710433C
MTTRTPDTGPAVRTRRVLAVLASLAGGPLLLLYGYLLAWFSPEVTSDRAADRGAVLWVVLLATCVAAAGCLLGGWLRLGRPGRWWPWPVGVAAALAVGWLAAGALL